MRFHALGTEFRVHFLTLLSALLAVALGAPKEMLTVAAAMGLHETAHLLAARVCNLQVDSVELMPFGGAARLHNLYGIPRGKMIAVALAGPGMNLLCALMGAALGWWELAAFPATARWVRIHLALMLFNLMPVIPLDGGRVLYALGQGLLGSRRALRLGVTLAHLLATALTLLAIFQFVRMGRMNLTLPLMAVFLLASSLSEKAHFESGGAFRAVETLCAPVKLPCRAEVVALDATAPWEAALPFLRRGKPVLFVRLGKTGPEEWTPGWEVAQKIVAEPAQTNNECALD